MEYQWLTVSVIIFGIIVAIGGVIAYWRVYRNSVSSFHNKDSGRNRPPVFPPEDNDLSGGKEAQSDK